MEIKTTIGFRIKELRQAKGLSQEALAFKAGIDRTYMTGVENGKRNISVQILNKILIALDISFKEFFNYKSFENEQ